MPMGLVEYMAQFFAVDNLQQVQIALYLNVLVLILVTGDLSNRLSSMATDNVMPLWTEMGEIASWVHVVYS